MLAVLCTLALASRLALAFGVPHITHPDAIFQTLEQAHRLAFGYGIVPWEFLEGVRSWILPGLLVVVFRASDLVLHVNEAYLIGTTIILSLLSLAPVICGFLWAYQFGGERAAMVAAGFTAVWFELVYFGPAALGEVCATHLMIIGMFLAFPGVPVPSRGRLIIAGVALGLAFVLRIQLLPALFVVAIYAFCIRRRQRVLIIVFGFALPFFGSGLLDWFTWSYPWQSMWKYFYLNVMNERSHFFGVVAWHYYMIEFAVFWSFALVPMLCLIWLGTRRMPLLAAVAASILVSHSLIGHKEYRFVYPAIAILIILAGMGSSELLSWMRLNSWTAAALYLSGVAILSASLALRDNYRIFFIASQGEIRAFREIGMDSQACGILLWHDPWWSTPGYTGLHRNLPIYESVSEAQPPGLSSAANYLVSRSLLQQPGEFSLRRSFPGYKRVYLYHRAGGCSQQHLAERLIYPASYRQQAQSPK